MRVVAVRSDADVTGGLHRCGAERTERAARRDDLKDLLAEEVGTVEIELEGDGGEVIVPGLAIGAGEDDVLRLAVHAEGELCGLQFEPGTERKNSWCVVGIGAAGTVAIGRVLEGGLKRIPNSDELFFLQPDCAKLALQVHCPYAKTTLSGHAYCFGLNGHHLSQF